MSLSLLHYRGGEEEFRLGLEYSRSDDAGDRATGADILAQLGWGDHEIRGEALVGLAKRGDVTLVPELIREWRNNDVSLLSIEAAEETGDARLYRRLKNLSEILNLEDDPSFAKQLTDAIKACKPERND